MPESMLMAAKGVVLIGLKATPQALLKEQDTKNTETSLRMLSVGQTSDLHKGDTPSSGDVSAHGSLRFRMAPADEILLTQRIINRALEVLRVHQGDKEKYVINRTSCFECLKNSFECCLGCYPARSYDPFRPTDDDLLEVQGSPDESDGLHPGESKQLLRKPLTLAGEPGKADNIIQQVFPLHDKRVNHHLWHMFWRELFCGLCCKVTKFDHYPMLRFCDEVRYHHGNEVAIFFAFGAYTLVNLFILTCICSPLALAPIIYLDPFFDAVLRGCVGLAVLLIWAPLYLRFWDRQYAVLVVRWNLGDTDQLYENPHDPEYEWVYDARLRRKVREYQTTCRPFVKSIFLPLAGFFIILAMLDQTLFAVWGSHQMTLPPCEDCHQMLQMVNLGPESFNNTMIMPYDRYWYGVESDFVRNRSYEEFAFGWTNLNNISKERNCFPTVCNQVFMWWDTCWDNPRGLLPATEANDGTGVGSPFIPFILFTVLLMRPISSIFQGIYEALIRYLTRLENWATLEKYNALYTQRHFVAYFIDVFWFNIMIVFILVRFGPAIMHQEVEICMNATVRAVAHPEDNTVVSLKIDPDAENFPYQGFVDFWYQIPFNDFDIALGVWNPTNVLITGEWVGLTFDLVLLRLNFLTMMFWCGFFPTMFLKCQRCRRRRCCRGLQDNYYCCRVCCGTHTLANDTHKPNLDGYTEGAREHTEILRRYSQDVNDETGVWIARETSSGVAASTYFSGQSGNVNQGSRETSSDLPSEGVELTPMSGTSRQHVSDTDSSDAAVEEGHDAVAVNSKELIFPASISTNADARHGGEESKNNPEDNQPEDSGALPHRTLSSTLEEAVLTAERTRKRRVSDAGLRPRGNMGPVLDSGDCDTDEVIRSKRPGPAHRQSTMALLANIATVTNLRGYDQDELLRIANMNQLHDCDGAISHIKVVSHAASVMLFSMFFPLLIPICFIGLFLDLVAEMTGMLSASKYTVLPYTGPLSVQAWRWSMTVSQFLAIPIVFSYFSFTILEMMQCQNPAVYADGTTGDALNVGQTYCFDANYNNWSFNHAPYGLVWLALSLCGLVWVKFLLSTINKEPDIVQRERTLRDIISHCGADQDEMAHGLSVSQVPQLRAIYDHADEMPRKPGQGMPGDGEVPLNNIKLVLSTLVAFHIPTKARDEARLTRTRTSIYRHEAESLERVFGGDGNDENDKERSRLLMATALLFDSDSSNTTQFVEFTLGIGNLRRNQGQLDLFGISVEQLDTNVAEYAEMLDTIKAILNPRAPRRSKSAEMLRNQYKRMSIHKGKILRTRSGALERGVRVW
eukprot:INCI15858.3.p1 GENE.INCI15858.3~~INCI15858.3.p1  ORF type:complete len:1508 (+),score=201.45 INCI15858.3:610-4524(+)